MDVKTRTLIDELNNIIPEKDKFLIIEARANHLIASAVNLISMIKESFPEDESSELIKRLFLSIKNEDQAKFRRGIKKLKESRKPIQGSFK